MEKQLPRTAKQLLEAALEKQSCQEKRGYGVADEYGMLERYLDGGHVYGEPPDKIMEDIRNMRAEADLNNVDLRYSPYRYHQNPETQATEEYDADAALRYMQEHADALAAYRTNKAKPGMKGKAPEMDYSRAPMYYSMIPRPDAAGKVSLIDWDNWKTPETAATIKAAARHTPESRKTLTSASPRSAKQLLEAALEKKAATPRQLALLERLKQLGIVGLGAGATYGIARGLHGMTRQPLSLGSGSNVPTLLPIAKTSPEEDGPQASQRPQLKLAEGFGDTLAGMLPEPNNTNVMTGNGIPYAAMATAVPAVAAYKGVRGLFDANRKAKQEAALAEAKKQYEQSLADQYRSVVTGKTAEAKEVADGIDAIFEKIAVERDAFSRLMGLLPVANPENVYGSAAVGMTNGALGKSPAEGFNSLRGLTTLGMLLSGGGAAKYMYDKSLKTSPDKIMQEAIGRRSRQRRSVPNVLTPQLTTAVE
jgi:hypothetical protein